MSRDSSDPIEGLKENALSSYGENRLDAIETLATFGEDAIPALVEITNESSNQEPQQLAREKIRKINQGGQLDIDTSIDDGEPEDEQSKEAEDNEGNS